MHFFLSGYYGYGNAGDEAVLAAMLEALQSQKPAARFTVASGNPAATKARFGSEYSLEAVPRQGPRELAAAIKSCDVFISGGGSLLQDVTSLRNIVYYTSLMHFARLSRKPVAVYAQGIGPLLRPLSQKLARAAVQSARVITVRDEDSKALLQRIGVRRNIEVTADPVWNLTPASDGVASTRNGTAKTFALSLRPWPGYEFDPARSSTIRDGLRALKQQRDAHLRFVPMQASSDTSIGELLREADDETIHTADLHPRAIMAACGNCDVMIAMRLHALIFAAAQGVPCVAVNYDPKVEALAKLIGAPLLQNLSESELARLPEAVQTAQPLRRERLEQLQSSARRSAELVSQLA
ncbi:MAG TPA: polysaccharide pyruvyl transferase CsaB [Abditibacteriaceae bacterium]|jgi:polysaccharide pyruvyl transferase CsaB